MFVEETSQKLCLEEEKVCAPAMLIKVEHYVLPSVSSSCIYSAKIFATISAQDKTRPFSVSFLFHASGKDSHSLAWFGKTGNQVDTEFCHLRGLVILHVILLVILALVLVLVLVILLV